MTRFSAVLFSLILISSCRDDCENTQCFNGGICDEGECVCEDHFYGDNCEYAETPVKVYIERIDVNEFPPDDNGDDWDPFIDTEPDIMVEIYNEDSATTLYETPVFGNIPPGSQFSYNGLDIELSNPGNYSLKMWDEDILTGNVSMGEASFIPYAGPGFPESFTVSDSTAQLDFTIWVSYVW